MLRMKKAENALKNAAKKTSPKTKKVKIGFSKFNAHGSANNEDIEPLLTQIEINVDDEQMKKLLEEHQTSPVDTNVNFVLSNSVAELRSLEDPNRSIVASDAALSPEKVTTKQPAISPQPLNMN